MPLKTGRLFLVVGPSGVGKDSVLDGARAHLSDASNVVFPKRIITRPEDAGGEDHQYLDEPAFAAQAASGGFALDWQAHGFHYGISNDIYADIEAGKNVIINVSRTVIDTARERFENVTVVSITADPQAIADRLRQRGRESEAEVAKRIARGSLALPADTDIRTVDNSATLDEAVSAFCALIAMAK